MPSERLPKKRGRAANPYTSQYWGERWPYRYEDRFDVGPELATDPRSLDGDWQVHLAPFTPDESQLETAIRWILCSAFGPDGTNPVPLVRTMIESTLRLVHNAPPRLITMALQRLCGQTELPPLLRVYRTELPIKDQSMLTLVYSIGRQPARAELETLAKLSRRRQKDYDRHKGRRAELYVWELLYRTGRFRLNEKAKCGKIPAPASTSASADATEDDRKHSLDVLATGRDSGVHYGISVKNIREEIYGGHHAIKDAWTKAKAHGAVPVLVAAHIGIEGQEACRSRGVVAHSLDRQLLPKELPDGRHMSGIVHDLMAILGPQRYEYLPKQLRWIEPSEVILRDLDFFDNLAPLQRNWAHEVWSIGTQRRKAPRTEETGFTDEPIAIISPGPQSDH